MLPLPKVERETEFEPYLSAVCEAIPLFVVVGKHTYADIHVYMRNEKPAGSSNQLLPTPVQ